MHKTPNLGNSVSHAITLLKPKKTCDCDLEPVCSHMLMILLDDLYERYNRLQKTISRNPRNPNDECMGNRIFNGSAIPTNNIGTVGDLYIDTTTNNLYIKTGNGWHPQVNLRGPPGTPGHRGL